jgi:hypothetical protein
MLVDADHSVTTRPGRTATALDDRLTRAVGALPMTVALLVAAALYAGVGLALPLALELPTVGLIGLNITGALFGWVVTLAWLFPVVENESATS